MDTKTLNEILEFIEADYTAGDKLPVSSQREVFQAIQTSTQSQCILKVCEHIPVRVSRIQREIRILTSLDSDYFPRFHFQTFVTESILGDFFDNFNLRVDEQRQRFEQLLVMQIRPFLLTVEEFIEHLDWDHCTPELRDEKRLVELLIHLFKALSLLWQGKIVHRDLKPENILIRGDYKPVIIDLGIAKSFRPGTAELTHPLFGTPCTPRYAAPEQLINNKTEITYKTDQFAIGVIAFFVLTGRFPYGDECEIGVATVVENMMQERMERIQSYNDELGAELVNFIERLLQVKPYKRYRTIKTIMEQLIAIRESLA